MIWSLTSSYFILQAEVINYPPCSLDLYKLVALDCGLRTVSQAVIDILISLVGMVLCPLYSVEG